MKLIIGGAIAIILSIVGFAYFFSEFLKFLAGTIPIILLLSGGVALYIYREMRCDECEEDGEPKSCLSSETEPSGDNAQPWQQEAAEEPVDTSVAEKKEEAQPETAEEPPAESVAEETSAGAAASESDGCIGNEESKVFHKLDCQYAKSKKCTAEFTTADEAVAAGFKACGVCKP
jgi:hypothetical protein